MFFRAFHDRWKCQAGQVVHGTQGPHPPPLVLPPRVEPGLLTAQGYIGPFPGLYKAVGPFEELSEAI